MGIKEIGIKNDLRQRKHIISQIERIQLNINKLRSKAIFSTVQFIKELSCIKNRVRVIFNLFSKISAKVDLSKIRPYLEDISEKADILLGCAEKLHSHLEEEKPFEVFIAELKEWVGELNINQMLIDDTKKAVKKVCCQTE